MCKGTPTVPFGFQVFFEHPDLDVMVPDATGKTAIDIVLGKVASGENFTSQILDLLKHPSARVGMPNDNETLLLSYLNAIEQRVSSAAVNKLLPSYAKGLQQTLVEAVNLATENKQNIGSFCLTENVWGQKGGKRQQGNGS